MSNLNCYAVRIIDNRSEKAVESIIRIDSESGATIRAGLTITAYTAWSTANYDIGDVVVCKFTHGLVLAVIVDILKDRAEPPTAFDDREAYTAPEIVDVVIFDDYVRTNEARRKSSMFDGLNKHLMNKYRMRITNTGRIQKHRCTDGQWCNASSSEICNLIDKSASFSAIWSIATLILERRGARLTTSAICDEIGNWIEESRS